MAQPKTAKERRFVEYANSLPPIDPEKVEWGYRNLLPATAYYWRHRGNKAEMWCQCCGHSENVDLCYSLIETWTCPHCGKECKVKNKSKDFTPIVEGRVMSVFEVYNGVQVVRTVEVMRDNTERGRTELYFRERYQNWILDKGQEIITCQPYTRSFSGGIKWEDGLFGISKAKRNGYYYNYLFSVNDNWLYPKVQLADYMRRRGLNVYVVKAMLKWRGENLANSIRNWVRTPYYETLWKAKERELFKYFMTSYRDLNDYKDSIRIARRNGYKFPDIGMWVDYVGELRELGMDTRSPRYLCPADLREAHRLTNQRVRRRRAEQEKERQKAQIVEREKAYGSFIKPYLDLCFEYGGIIVAVLPTVKSVYDEGEAMHHCIYSNGYYKRTDTLLLSARDKETGNRIESIEVSLTAFKVMQSRGKYNKDTDQHDKILRIMRRNMDKIKTIRQQAV